jgi:hypothetical protein
MGKERASNFSELQSHNAVVEYVRSIVHPYGYTVTADKQTDDGRGRLRIVHEKLNRRGVLRYHMPESMQRLDKDCRDIMTDFDKPTYKGDDKPYIVGARR